MFRRVRRVYLGAATVGAAAAAAAVVAAIVPLARVAATASPATAPATAPAVALPQLLKNTVPEIVASASKLGAVASSTPLTVIAPLTLAHQSAMTSYIESEYSSSSPNYHHFLTPSAFASYFGATSAHVRSVTRTLSSLGFAVAPVASNRLYVKFSGTAGLIERTFGTVIDRLQLPGALSTFVSNVTNLVIPAKLSGLVSGLIGLNSLNVPHDNLATPTPAAVARARANIFPSLPDIGIDGGSTPCVGAIAGAGYTAPQLAQGYDFNGLYSKGLLGQGMTASLVEFDDYHDSNVDTLQRCYGDKATSVNRVMVDGGSGGPPGAGEDEDMLDIGVMLEMLPQLANLDVYVAPITGTAELDLYNAFVTNDDSPVLSSSWGNCEELDSQSDAILFNTVAEEAAAQGQQIFDAAGDSGAVDCRGYPSPTGGSISVETESASPYVTAVGGTDLAVTSVLGLGHTEDTWNDGGAGGGGQSTFWTMPSWQAALPSVVDAPGGTGAACGAPAGTLCREIPDLSADADPDEGMQSATQFQFTDDVGSPGYDMYCNTPNCSLLDVLGLPLPITLPTLNLPEGLGGWFPIGGTSAATPLTAAAYVLWDQEAVSEGLSGLGFVNPALYEVAADPTKYANDFFDITTDSNDAQYDASDCPAGCNTNHLYQAATGYDMASGLGSYDASNLGGDLVAEASQLTVTPADATVYGYTKGPSTTTPIVVSSGYNGAPYTVTTSAPWLHASNGTIGGSLAWSADPSGLAPGTYQGTISITGHQSNALVSVTYEVTPPASVAVTPWTMHFSEGAVTSSGESATPSCGSTIWDDEFAGIVGGTTPSDQSDAPSKQNLTIINDGAPGSVLHWSAFFYSGTSGWLDQDLTPPGAKIQVAPTQPIVPTTGTLAAGARTELPLVSLADGNLLGGYPDMNQGTYHGVVEVYDLADPNKVMKVPAVMVLGNGSATPTVDASPGSLAASVPSGGTGMTTLNLSDASKACGYAYSARSTVPWATVDEASYAGTVAPGATTAAVPIDLDASGLSPGTYHGDVVIQSQNAEPDPVTVPITLTVTG